MDQKQKYEVLREVREKRKNFGHSTVKGISKASHVRYWYTSTYLNELRRDGFVQRVKKHYYLTEKGLLKRREVDRNRKQQRTINDF